MNREELKEINKKFSFPLYWSCMNPERILFPFIDDGKEMFFLWRQRSGGDYYIVKAFTLEELTEDSYILCIRSHWDAICMYIPSYIPEFIKKKYLEYKELVKKNTCTIKQYEADLVVHLYFENIIVSASSTNEAADKMKNYIMNNYKNLNPTKDSFAEMDSIVVEIK